MVATGGIENIRVKKINEFGKEGTYAMNANYRVLVWFRSGMDFYLCKTYQKVPEGTTIDDMLRERDMFIGAKGIMSMRHIIRRYGLNYHQMVDITDWACSNPDDDAERKVEVLQSSQEHQETKSKVVRWIDSLFEARK